MKQRTEEWFAARVGKATASRIADIMSTRKDGKPSASRVNYCSELAAERLTGVPYGSISSAAMDWGTEQEPNARAAYEALTGKMVDEVGFIDHPTIPMSGASPDGLLDDGLIEVKCPNTATHINTLRTRKIEGKYQIQMLWQMACSERSSWCEFVSYDPRMPEHLQLVIIRFDRDDERIAEMEDAVRAFLSEVDELVKELEAL